MTAISYFQRFSQRENHATNNTLLVLRHLYQTSPAKLERVLHALLESEQISIGPQFEQQLKGSDSVPDGHIHQKAWSLFIETKLGSDLSDDQIERHIETISERADGGDTVLIGLTPGTPDQVKAARFADLARTKRITFKWTTFLDLVGALESQCADYETTLADIIADYREYLRGEDLLDARDDWILVVPCGQSYEDNKRFALYFDAAHRPARRGARYLGVYKNRTVSMLGDIVAVLVCSYRDGEIVVEREEFGKATTEHRQRIKAAIEAATYFDLKSTPQRYFLTDGLHETHIAKSNPGGIQGALYLNIGALLKRRRPTDLGSSELANALKGTSFPTEQ